MQHGLLASILKSSISNSIYVISEIIVNRKLVEFKRVPFNSKSDRVNSINK